MGGSRQEWSRFAPALFVALVIGGCMNHEGNASGLHEQPDARPSESRPRTGESAAVVRYQVTDVERSLDFYTRRLGFQLEHRAGSAFASVLRGELRLLLSGPGSSGSRPLDGQRQEPGGWNRIVLYIHDLDASIKTMTEAGVRVRGKIEVGPGGRQIQIEDPDGNLVELHEAPRGAT
ncbi:MAG TPA: VOC family protein [Kofleriaceae bacterium]|nr:VOC family protein [Kofleriaceae bacterium]